MLSSTTRPSGTVWLPTLDEYKDLIWTLFPDEIGQEPRCEDISEPVDLPQSVVVRMDDQTYDKLTWFAIASALPVQELIRRLLVMEVTLYGEFNTAE